jgi:hypothetical protein
MALWENASIKANRAGLSLRDHQDAPVETSTLESDLPNRWHPRRTLGFIVLSCGLFWGCIFALTRLF